VQKLMAYASGDQRDGVADPDTAVAVLKFSDGSVATVRYLANGEASIPKERIEIFCGGHVMTLDNFRAHRLVGPLGTRSWRSWLKASKGRQDELEDFVKAARGEQKNFDFELAVESSRIIFAIQKSLKLGETVEL